MSPHSPTERFPANCPGNRYWAAHELKVSPRTGVGPAGNSRLTGQKPLPRPGACALCHTISLPNVSRQIVRVTGTGRHMSSKYHRGRGVGPERNSLLTGQKPLPRPGACALCHTISLPNVSRQIVRVTGTGRHMSSKYHRGRGSVLREIADLPAKNPYQGQVLVHYVTPLAYRTFPGKLSG